MNEHFFSFSNSHCSSNFCLSSHSWVGVCLIMKCISFILIGILLEGRSFPPMYLFNYLYQYGCMEIYFILWIIIQYYCFLAQLVSAFSTGSSFMLASVSSHHPVISFWATYFYNYKLILNFPCHDFGFNSFSKEPWLLLRENDGSIYLYIYHKTQFIVIPPNSKQYGRAPSSLPPFVLVTSF